LQNQPGSFLVPQARSMQLVGPPDMEAPCRKSVESDDACLARVVVMQGHHGLHARCAPPAFAACGNQVMQAASSYAGNRESLHALSCVLHAWSATRSTCI
jgi:hypothetical protein